MAVFPNSNDKNQKEMTERGIQFGITKKSINYLERSSLEAKLFQMGLIRQVCSFCLRDR